MEAVFKIRVISNIKVYNTSIDLCQKEVLIQTLFKGCFEALLIFLKITFILYVKDNKIYIDQQLFLFP